MRAPKTESARRRLSTRAQRAGRNAERLNADRRKPRDRVARLPQSLARRRLRPRADADAAGRSRRPERRYQAVHIVGTNGKSTATVTGGAALLAEGRSVGATVSPHVRSWQERIRVTGARPTSQTRWSASGRCRTARRDPVRDDHRGRAGSVRRTRGRGGRGRGRASAAATMPRTCCARASCCSPTSASSTRTCSETRSRRLRERSLLLSILTTR